MTCVSQGGLQNFQLLQKTNQMQKNKQTTKTEQSKENQTKRSKHTSTHQGVVDEHAIGDSETATTQGGQSFVLRQFKVYT